MDRTSTDFPSLIGYHYRKYFCKSTLYGKVCKCIRLAGNHTKLVHNTIFLSSCAGLNIFSPE